MPAVCKICLMEYGFCNEECNGECMYPFTVDEEEDE